MEDKEEMLRAALESMSVVTVSAARELTGLPEEEIIAFVRARPSLRIFDDRRRVWINERARGHC